MKHFWGPPRPLWKIDKKHFLTHAYFFWSALKVPPIDYPQYVLGSLQVLKTDNKSGLVVLFQKCIIAIWKILFVLGANEYQKDW